MLLLASNVSNKRMVPEAVTQSVSPRLLLTALGYSLFCFVFHEGLFNIIRIQMWATFKAKSYATLMLADLAIHQCKAETAAAPPSF